MASRMASRMASPMDPAIVQFAVLSDRSLRYKRTASQHRQRQARDFVRSLNILRNGLTLDGERLPEDPLRSQVFLHVVCQSGLWRCWLVCERRRRPDDVELRVGPVLISSMTGRLQRKHHHERASSICGFYIRTLLISRRLQSMNTVLLHLTSVRRRSEDDRYRPLLHTCIVHPHLIAACVRI